MSALKQIGTVTAMNLRSVPQRLGTSSVIVIGIAGVVAVLLSVLAMSVGLMKSMSSTGRPDRAIVTRAGSNSELASSMSREAAITIMNAPGIRRGSDGKPIASAESITLVELRMKNADVNGNVTLRGVGPAAFALRPEMKIVEGRVFRPAVHEVIVGRKAQMQYAGADIGDQIMMRDTPWTVVGIFETGGDQHESELVVDVETMLSAYQRQYFQPVTVQLESLQAFEAFETSLTTNPNLSVDVKRESDHYADQSKTLSRVLAAVAYVVGGIMAVGALFGALNTMYSAVSVRLVEIATLRALGFGATPVVISVFAEALVLALIGGLIGCFAAWLLFDGHVLSTSGGNIFQLVFALAVTPGMIGLGVAWACIIGLIGGLPPAIRAARLPVAAALRAT